MNRWKSFTDKGYMTWLYTLLILGCFIYLIADRFINQKKIAYVDSNKIYNGYKGIVNAKVEFEKQVEHYKTRLDTLNGKVKVDILNIEKQRTDKAQYRKWVDSVNYHKRQLHDYQAAMNESLKQEESKLTQNAMLKLNEFLKEYGTSHGYDMIFIASPNGTIAFAKDQYDITTEVLKEVNEKL